MSGSDAAVRRVRTEGELLDAYAVRRAVFIVEQQVPEDIERDHLDATAEHVVAYVGGVAAGAGRLIVDGDVAHIGRLAVRAPVRGSGIGAALLDELESVALDRGCRVAELHAQLHARAFYERIDYVAEGPTFVEAGIEHVSMRKQLAGR